MVTVVETRSVAKTGVSPGFEVGSYLLAGVLGDGVWYGGTKRRALCDGGGVNRIDSWSVGLYTRDCVVNL